MLASELVSGARLSCSGGAWYSARGAVSFARFAQMVSAPGVPRSSLHPAHRCFGPRARSVSHFRIIHTQHKEQAQGFVEMRAAPFWRSLEPNGFELRVTMALPKALRIGVSVKSGHAKGGRPDYGGAGSWSFFDLCLELGPGAIEGALEEECEEDGMCERRLDIVCALLQSAIDDSKF